MKQSVDQAMRQARALSHQGDKTAAELVYRAILAKFPGNLRAAAELQALAQATIERAPESELDRLVTLHGERRWAEALEHAGPMLARYPHDEVLHNIVGALHAGLGQRAAAIAHYDQAIALAPDYLEACNNRGTALMGEHRLEEAVASFDGAIRLRADYADAHLNRAVALGRLKRLDDALTGFNRAIRLDPACAEAYNNRGNAFAIQHRLHDALADYDTAIRLKPHYADAFVNRGNVLKVMQRLDDAVASYDAAIALAPMLAEPHNNRGIALRALKRPQEALASHQEALRLKPDYALAYAEISHLQAHMCCWDDAPRDDALLDAGLQHEAIPPFYMFDLADDPARQLAYASAWAAEKFGGIRPGKFGTRVPGAKIRLGYFSADFHNHATMYLMARLFELHDKDRFEIHAFSYGEKAQDAMRGRLLDAVDAFHDATDLDDAAIARLSCERGIDIAIDLKGYTQSGRPGIFAHRAAPVQVGYLGYPGTMGTDFIDYMIADAVTVPEESRRYYSEQIVYLPHSYQVNDDRREVSDQPVSRADVGLPDDAFVFCCFNNNYKISPVEFDIWMRLLTQVEGSVLWLLQDNQWAADNLRREAATRGVDPARLVFADRAPLADHLARHRCADLFLDTFNVNAHTTASDALWAGLPVLTKAGRTFVARVAASLLHAIDLPELVTDDVESYERLALDLARDRVRLAAIRRKLADNRLTTPLFDTERYARDIEGLYEQLCGRSASRLAAAA